MKDDTSPEKKLLLVAELVEKLALQRPVEAPEPTDYKDDAVNETSDTIVSELTYEEEKKDDEELKAGAEVSQQDSKEENHEDEVGLNAIPEEAGNDEKTTNESERQKGTKDSEIAIEEDSKETPEVATEATTEQSSSEEGDSIFDMNGTMESPAAAESKQESDNAVVDSPKKTHRSISDVESIADQSVDTEFADAIQESPTSPRRNESTNKDSPAESQATPSSSPEKTPKSPEPPKASPRTSPEKVPSSSPEKSPRSPEVSPQKSLDGTPHSQKGGDDQELKPEAEVSQDSKEGGDDVGLNAITEDAVNDEKTTNRKSQRETIDSELAVEKDPKETTEEPTEETMEQSSSEEGDSWVDINGAIESPAAAESKQESDNAVADSPKMTLSNISDVASNADQSVDTEFADAIQESPTPSRHESAKDGPSPAKSQTAPSSSPSPEKSAKTSPPKASPRTSPEKVPSNPEKSPRSPEASPQKSLDGKPHSQKGGEESQEESNVSQNEVNQVRSLERTVSFSPESNRDQEKTGESKHPPPSLLLPDVISPSVTPRADETPTHSNSGWQQRTLSEIIRKDLWSRDPNIVKAGLQQITIDAFYDEKARSVIARAGGLFAIVRAMEQHVTSATVQIGACQALEKLALDTDNEIAIADVGGIDAILGAMMGHYSNATVQEAAWSALWNLTCCNADKSMTVDTSGGIAAIVAAMKQHSDEPNVQKNACGALANLCLDNEARLTALSDAGGFVAIATALQRHWKNPDVRNEASHALAVLLGQSASVYEVPIDEEFEVRIEED